MNPYMAALAGVGLGLCIGAAITWCFSHPGPALVAGTFAMAFVLLTVIGRY